MNAALEWHVAHRRAGRGGDPEVFDLDGHRARLLPDHSSIWDRGQRHKPHAVELLDHVQAWLGELAEEGDGNAELADLLRTLVRTCRLAVVWRRLLDLGALHPDQVGMRIRGVAWSLPVLVCRDTIGPVGKMVGAVFLDLSARDRERIERAVLSIPAEAPPEHPQSAERQRDRLLGCLPENGLVTLESRARLSQHAWLRARSRPTKTTSASRSSQRSLASWSTLPNEESPWTRSRTSDFRSWKPR